jgi:L-amino acid N-acyltransferase YncA
MAYLVRGGRVEDLDAIYDIWRQGIINSLGAAPSGDTDYRAYFQHRLESQNDVFRYFVVENAAGEIISWQSLSPFRSNPAVAGIMAELSAYTASEQMPGRPTLLGLEETFRFADRSPLHYVVAFIAMNNARALRLADHLGMLHIGTFPKAPQAPHLPELAYLVYPCKTSSEAAAHPDPA